MKKKLFVLLAVLVLILASLACGSSNGDLEDAVEELGDASEDLQEAVEEALGDASEDLQEEVEEALGNGGDSVDEPETEEEEPEPTKTTKPTNTPEPTNTPKLGTSRSNPAPVGSEVIVDDMAFMVLSATRPADDIVRAGNMFNTDPESDQEYILVEVQVTCKKTTDEQCSLNPSWDLTLIGSSGVVIEPEFMVTGVEGMLESVEFYGEAMVSGLVPFIIDQSETDIVLVYEPLLFGDTMYLAIP